MQRFILLTFLFLLLGNASLFSQKLSVNESIFTQVLPEKQDFFFMDEEAELVFIDLNKVEENVLKIQVLNESQNIISEESMRQFNSDYIHEVDYSVFKKGNYTVQLITDKETLKQDFSVLP